MPSLVTTGPAILYAAVFVVVLAWAATAAGRRMMRWFGADGGSALERGIVALSLGMGVFSFVPFALGVFGVLGISSLRITMALCVLVLAPDLWGVARGVSSRFRSLQKPERWLLAWALAFLPTLLLAALLAATPALDPDGLAYHLTAPKRWLASGSLEYLPTYFITNAPMGVEMLFGIGLALAGDAGAKSLHLAMGLGAAVALFLAGRRLRGDVTGALAVTIFLVGPTGVGSLLGWAYLEGATSLAMYASTLAWLVWFQRRSAGWLRCAAMLGGISVAFKLTSGLFPLALGALTVCALWDDARSRGAKPLAAVVSAWPLALLAALPVTPWLIRSAVVTGNPFFPMFASLIPSRDYSPAVAAQSEIFNRYESWGLKIGASLGLAQRKAILAGVGLFGALVAGPFWFFARSFVARACAVVLLVTFLAQLGAVGLYARYWTPLVPLLALPAIALLEPLLRRPWLKPALVAAAAAGSLLQVRGSLRIIGNDLGGLVRTAFGLEPQRVFITRHLPLFPAYERANLELPAKARIVLVNYCGGFYLDRTTYCAELVQDALRLSSWPVFVSDLKRLGVTHALAPRGLASDGPPPMAEAGSAAIIRERQNALFRRLLSDYGRLLVSAHDQGLYAIDVATLFGRADSTEPNSNSISNGSDMRPRNH